MTVPAAGAPATAPPAALPLGAAPSNLAWTWYANRGWISAPHDTPAHQLAPPRILGEVEIGQSIVDALGVSGRAALTTGALDLANHDRALDDLVRSGRADGRRIVLRVGAIRNRRASDAGVPLAAMRTVFRGRTAQAAHADARVRLALGDALDVLDVPLQPNRYDGGGGLGGVAALAGLPRPVTMGECFNIAPVYIGEHDFGDGNLPTFQSHWRAISEHLKVRERGVEMAEVTGTAPGIGEWRDWPAQGCFQLGFDPAGTITCDLRGDAVGSWASTTTEIVPRLLTSLGPVLSADDLDAASIAAAAIALPGVVGLHIGTEPVSTLDALTTVCTGALAHLWVTRAGRIGLSALTPPAAVPDLVVERYDQIVRETLPPPSAFWPLPAVIEVEHGRNWTVLSDIAGSVPEALRARLSAPSGLHRAVSGTAATFTGRTRALRLPGLWRDAADAATRAAALRTLVDRLPHRYRIVTDRYRGQVQVGHTAEIALPSGRWRGVVVGWREWLVAERVELDLWG